MTATPTMLMFQRVLRRPGKKHEGVGTKDAAAALAVGNLRMARDFYENTLGLEPLKELPGSVLYKSGNSIVLVYRSEYAGTNQATSATWTVGDDFEAIVHDLNAKGVSFGHYGDVPDATSECDMHVVGELTGVWFKDPDGNILSLVNLAM
jgi:catechol 2,3-dioxygenase-like lactoylglutathione lyase family enzyme